MAKTRMKNSKLFLMRILLTNLLIWSSPSAFTSSSNGLSTLTMLTTILYGEFISSSFCSSSEIHSGSSPGNASLFRIFISSLALSHWGDSKKTILLPVNWFKKYTHVRDEHKTICLWFFCWTCNWHRFVDKQIELNHRTFHGTNSGRTGLPGQKWSPEELDEISISSKFLLSSYPWSNH